MTNQKTPLIFVSSFTKKIKTMNATYKILGVNDDKDFCSCCGKQGLKKVVWLEHLESSEVNHFGTSCAAKLLFKTSGKRVSAKYIGLPELTAILNECMDKHWGLPRKEFETAVAIDLIKKGVDKNFEHLSGATNAFCSFIWPYQKQLGK